MKKRVKKKSGVKIVEKAKLEEPGRDGEGQPAKVVPMFPVLCPRCNSPRRKRFRDGILGTSDFDCLQVHKPTGIKFDRIIRRSTECIDCGQRLIVSEYTRKPEKS